MSTNIPIRDKKTGKTTEGKSAKSQKNYRQNRNLDVRQKSLDSSSQEDLKKENSSQEKNNFSCDEGNGKKEAKSKAKIDNLEDFIADIYSSKCKRIEIKPEQEKKLAQNLKFSEESIIKLKENAKNDLPLNITRQLLLAAQKITSHSNLKSAIINFIQSALENHPFFVEEKDLLNLIHNHPESIGAELAIKKIIDKNYLENKNLKENLRLNYSVAYCLALWIFEKHNLNLYDLTKLISNAIWKHAAEKNIDKNIRLQSLAEIQDSNFIGVYVACTIFQEQIELKNKHLNEANQKLSKASNENEKFQSEIEHLKEEISKRDSQIKELEKLLDQERESHTHTRLNLLDEIEKMRTRLIRRLKSEIGLLMDGLHALRRDPPKVHVMDDHAERAIDALKQELKHLNSSEN